MHINFPAYNNQFLNSKVWSLKPPICYRILNIRGFMKYFLAMLLTFCIFASNNQLQASEFDKLLTYSWGVSEEELYLDIQLSDDLEFADDYSTFATIDDNGQGCEIICKPIYEGAVTSSKGEKLSKIILTVVLSNVSNPNKVSFLITKKCCYSGVDIIGREMSIVTQTKREGMLNTPAIDLTVRPNFFSVDDETQNATISFTNSFPYSDLE